MTPEIAEIRGVPVGRDVVSPSRHTAFHDIDSMLDFVETIAEATGLPVGIKAAVGGDPTFWQLLVDAMRDGERGVDFVTVDGGEGGTGGAAPLVFADSVSLPFRSGFARVHRQFAEAGLAERVTFIGSGKLGMPDNAVAAMALGCDMVNVAREPMFALGVHPGAEVPHRSMPHRRGHPECMAGKRTGRPVEGGPGGAVSPGPAT